MSQKEQLRKFVEEVMHGNGWGERAIEGLPTVFARDADVTPYFRLDGSPRRPFGDLIVEGAIGTIHRSFEQQWRHYTGARENQLAHGLHLANFRQLHERFYVPAEGDIEEPVKNFCLAVIGILNNMPSNEAEPINAYTAGSICGFPFSAFSIYSQREKFQQFEAYIGRLAQQHHSHGSQ